MSGFCSLKALIIDWIIHASPEVALVSLPASSQSPKNLAIVISTADALKLKRDRNDAKNNVFSDKEAIKIGFKEIIYISSEHKKGFDDIYNSLIKMKNFRNSEKIIPSIINNNSQIKISFIGEL